jgi:hypothetical protein
MRVSIEEIRRTPEWRDAVASRLLSATGDPVAHAGLAAPPDEIARAAISDVLRETHAARARELPFLKWPTVDNAPEFLIQDSELRASFGNVIGTIAESHWWHASELRELPSRVNAGGKVPAGWFVNPIKIACLLRVADAAHIDHRRAPRFLRSLLRLNQSSEIHWAFQEKLGKPSIDKNFLVYTGSCPFDVSEAEAWWLGYDMLAAIDDELPSVHGVLDDKRINSFVVTAVKGAKSPHAIAKLIPTKGWKPVNTELRVSDVPSLAEKLGGQQLYGADLAAPVRELIQNASDAIQARRLFCNLDSKYGTVKVTLRRTANADFIEFQDDGIGMSARVLTGALLDFGCSFWRSAAMRQEFPGLLSKGLRTTGQFGIGFFAVFMLGDRVTVTSRRFDAAVSDTHTLDFQKGLRIRPVLREPTQDESLPESGTRVCVTLRNRYDADGGLLVKCKDKKNKVRAALRDLVAHVSPAISVTVEIAEGERQEIAVKADDWLTQNPRTLIERAVGSLDPWYLQEITQMLPNLRLLIDPSTGETHGRACVAPGHYFPDTGVVTVGGFRASGMQRIAGVIKGKPDTVARSSAMPTVTALALRNWASEQATLISRTKVSGEIKLRAASIIMLCGGEALCLPMAIYDGEYLTASSLEELLRPLVEVIVYDGFEIEYDEDDNVRPKDFKDDFKVSSTLLFVPDRTPAILRLGSNAWPECVTDLYLPGKPKCCEDSFKGALKRAWGAEPTYEEDLRVVGKVGGDQIWRTVRIYSNLSGYS